MNEPDRKPSRNRPIRTKKQFVRFMYNERGDRLYWSETIGGWVDCIYRATKYSFNQIPCFKGFEIL